METQTIVLILIGVVILSIIVKICRNIILTLMPLIALIVSLVKSHIGFRMESDKRSFYMDL